jgi:hypothetical protein
LQTGFYPFNSCLSRCACELSWSIKSPVARLGSNGTAKPDVSARNRGDNWLGLVGSTCLIIGLRASKCAGQP